MISTLILGITSVGAGLYVGTCIGTWLQKRNEQKKLDHAIKYNIKVMSDILKEEDL